MRCLLRRGIMIVVKDTVYLENYISFYFCVLILFSTVPDNRKGEVSI